MKVIQRIPLEGRSRIRFLPETKKAVDSGIDEISSLQLGENMMLRNFTLWKREAAADGGKIESLGTLVQLYTPEQVI